MYYKLSFEHLPKVTEFYYVERNTTWRCADKNNILVFVTKGKGYFEVNSNKILVKEGQAILIPANTPYVRSAYNDTLATYCYAHFYTDKPIKSITYEELEEEAKALVESHRALSLEHSDEPHPSQHAFLTKILNCDGITISQLEEISKEDYRPTNPYRQLTASLSLGKLILRFSRKLIKSVNSGKEHRSAGYPVPLQKALLYIEKNYRKKITTQQLSEFAGVSVQHMIRLFKTHLNATPLSYVNKYKTACAMEMLRHNDISIKEIAYELGFDNPNYFSRLFKKQESMSPSSRRGIINTYDKQIKKERKEKSKQ